MCTKLEVNVDEKIIIYIEQGDTLYAACANVEKIDVDVDVWTAGLINHRTNFKIVGDFHHDIEYVKNNLKHLTKQCTKVDNLLDLTGYSDCGAIRRHEGCLHVNVMKGSSDFSTTARVQGSLTAMAEIWHLFVHLPFTMDIGIV